MRNVLEDDRIPEVISVVHLLSNFIDIAARQGESNRLNIKNGSCYCGWDASNAVLIKRYGFDCSETRQNSIGETATFAA